VLLLLDTLPTTASALNIPLQLVSPGGFPAVTVVLTEPMPPVFENPRAAAQLLFRFPLGCNPQANAGLNVTLPGEMLVLITLSVSPVDRLRCEGLWLTLMVVTTTCPRLLWLLVCPASATQPFPAAPIDVSCTS
jgi:hypothetical protein